MEPVPLRTVTVHENVTEEFFRQVIYTERIPVILRGVDVGTCVSKWTSDYLAEKIGNVDVKVHVGTNPKLDFVTKNFAYKTLPLHELLKRASTETKDNFFFDPNEYYYLRSLGSDPRGREVADIRKQFPDLACDIKIPNYFEDSQFFSSVFRIGSKGVQLWTHYDVMDNILIQVKGRKRMVLYSPNDALNMYLIGDKSQVTDIDNPDPKQFPLFIQATRYECLMEPGDILFIPALWFHNALALDFGIAVNVFWKHLSDDLYDRKDPYGNKDLLPAARAFQMIENATKALDSLPDEYKNFYGKKIIAALENKYKQKRPK